MHIGRFVSVALCGLAVTSCASPRAPSPPIPNQAQLFIERLDNRGAVKQIMSGQWSVTVGAACTAITPAKWDVEISAPLEFDAQGKPLKGAWKEIITADGCGARKVLNVQSAITSDGTVKRVGMLPGTSRANILLERDAIPHARLGAISIISSECKQVAIADTAFIEQEGMAASVTLPGRDSHPWREEWTIRGCGATAIVTVHFVPDATGTGIQVAPTETRRG